MIVTSKTLELLKAEMPYKWRIQLQSEAGATCVAYIDSRLAQDKLDEVVGSENWQTQFKVINDNLFCSVGIRVTHDDGTSEWIWKEDVGTESNVDKEKGNASDSFKRACVHFGIGRFLYGLDIQRIKTKQHTNKKFYPCDDKGNILWDGDQLTDYINGKIKKQSTTIVEKPVVTQKPSTKYETPKSEPKYNKTTYSEETIKRVSTLEKDGKKGKDCLKAFIPEFNKENKTNLDKIQDIDDTTLNKLIDFIEKQIPKNI